jgi:chromosomal replication initiation ATPase DnaA
MTETGRQLLLDFPRIDAAQRPVIDAGPYRGALTALRKWKAWPEGQLALVGAPFAGRTRLARLWAADAGAALVSGEALAAADIAEISNLSFGALAVDDADEASGLKLLAALNLCRERGAPILVTGQGEPAGWFGQPPDLRSRLAAIPVAEIGDPDDETLAARLQEEAARRHLNLPVESVNYLANRMPRSWQAVASVADQIERTAGRAYSRRSARAVLIALGISPD